MAATLTSKNVERAADEHRTFPNGHIEISTIGNATLGRAVFEPGWRWTESLRSIAGTDTCQVRHNGYIESGRLHIKMDDGAELDLGPGDFFVCDPGHDAWVIGNEACVAFDFSSDIARYAKQT
jgi:hypothetical protein